MEIKVNKEIREYKETIFFGLSMRQFACAAVAVGTAVLLYLILYRFVGKQIASWVCIAGAAPIAIAGFFHNNGMVLEVFLWAWFKSEILLSGNRGWQTENYYAQLLKQREEEPKPTKWYRWKARRKR